MGSDTNGRKHSKSITSALSLAAAVALPSFAQAESLQDALGAAYRSNPLLQSQRYSQRALDETYVQAEAGWRPTVSATLQTAYQKEPNSISLNQGFSSASFGYGSLTLTQPLYTGGRTAMAVRAAEATVMAGRQQLRSVESQVLFSVVQAYTDVLRDQKILEIRKSDQATLQRQFAESSAKYELGQVTKTDVGQAEAQMQAAKASMAAAVAALEISRSEFEAAVGEDPHQLEEPAKLGGLPETVDKAFDLAQTSNPNLLESQERERSSQASIAQAKAAYRPTVALQGSFGYIGPIAPFETRDYGQDVLVGVTLSLPILSGGVTSSQVRQATAQNGSDRAQIELARRQAKQTVSQTWNELLAGRAAIAAGTAQVKAAETALSGAQAEYGFGLRTTLDVLISDENLRAAQLSLAESQHDTLLAEASVLAVIGRLEAIYLLPAEPSYDPVENFRKQKRTASTPWEPLVKTIDQLGAPAAPSLGGGKE